MILYNPTNEYPHVYLTGKMGKFRDISPLYIYTVFMLNFINHKSTLQ